MRTNIVIYFKCFLLIILGCDTTSPNNDEPGLYGVVKDEKGNTISGVEVYLVYDILSEMEFTLGDGYYKYYENSTYSQTIVDTLFQNFPNPFNKSTSIRCNLSERSNVRINIKDYLTDDIIYTLVDEELLPGRYIFTLASEINNVILNNGLFKIQVEYYRDGEIVFEDYVKACIIEFDFDDISKTVHNDISDNNGRFRIPYNSIPFGVQFNRTSSIGPDIIGNYVIDNTVILILMKDSYLNLVKRVTFNSENPITEEFIMKK